MDLGSYSVDLQNELGRGSYGSVYIGTERKTSVKVAIKKISIDNDKKATSVMEEIRILKAIEDHKNIIKLIDFYYLNKSIWVVMEFCEEGDLNQYIIKTKAAMSERLKIMYQCACAVTHLHEQEHPVVHRDIKVKNILIKIINNQVIVKLTDLEQSKMVDVNDMIKTAFLSTGAGAIGYKAPEEFKNKRYGFAVDVFSMGLVYLALLVYKSEKNLDPKGMNYGIE